MFNDNEMLNQINPDNNIEILNPDGTPDGIERITITDDGTTEIKPRIIIVENEADPFSGNVVVYTAESYSERQVTRNKGLPNETIEPLERNISYKKAFQLLKSEVLDLYKNLSQN